jgi:hypothetical protein
MSPLWLALLLARLPCMPAELGLLPPAAHAPLPPPPPPPPPRPPAPSAPAWPSPALKVVPPSLSASELARYRIAYGVLNIGEISLAITAPSKQAGADGMLVRARGHGQGSILGMGGLENSIDAEFDAAHLASRRWSSARKRGDDAIHDVGEQRRQGEIDLTRQHEGKPPQRALAKVAGPALDPIGFLLRVRAAPPAPGARPEVLYVLDGQALWRVTLVNAGPEALPDSASHAPAVRLEAHADPIHYDGRPDEGDRTRRQFVLWLSDDAAHVPLRLAMPIGIADLVVALVELARAKP